MEEGFAICPACAEAAPAMGILGQKIWFRCDYCGMEFAEEYFEVAE